LNAALHFIKFAPHTKNLIVTDPSFNGTLANTKELVSTFQEGTFKKMNKDRNAKTTRNIQKGLQFTIDDVKRQTEDGKLVTDVDALADKYNGTHVQCHESKITTCFSVT